MSESTHAKAAFATISSILILQRADDLVSLIGYGKGTCEGRSRWHGLTHVSSSDRLGWKRGATLPPHSRYCTPGID